MKLRIRGDSIRLRLTRGEIEKFTAEGEVADSLDLGGQRFTYALRSAKDSSEVSAEFDGGVLRIFIPEADAGSWTDSEQVGIENAKGSVPRILIEKDFACLTARPGEDESDMFPNPTGATCHAGEG